MLFLPQLRNRVAAQPINCNDQKSKLQRLYIAHVVALFAVLSIEERKEMFLVICGEEKTKFLYNFGLTLPVRRSSRDGQILICLTT